MAKYFHTANACDARGLRTSFCWSGERILSGFVVDLSDPTRKFVVELLIDGLSVEAARADEYVHELARDDVGDGCYGFSFPLSHELVNAALVAEARIANLGTIIGEPIVLNHRAGIRRSNPCPGSVRWLGGLRFSGWLAGESDEPVMDVVVDGAVVMQVEASGWSHAGSDPEIARPVRAFGFHLPERFADGRARQLAVVKHNGDNLPGCPVTFVAFDGGLANTLAGLGALESEQFRAEQFDRLLPASVPLSQYHVWRERFPAPRTGPVALRAAVVMVGAGNMDDTLETLREQTHNQWIAASFPDATGPNGFDPKLVRAFLDSDAADSDFVVFGVAGTRLTATALERIAAAFVKFDHACAVYSDVEITGADNSIWPLAFSAFDYERLLEQGYCAHFFALRRATADRALISGVSDLYRLFNSLLDHETGSIHNIVHLPGALAALPEFDLDAARPVLAMATRTHLEARGIPAHVTPAASGTMAAVRVRQPINTPKTTIIIPTRNRRKLLQDCIQSIESAVKKQTAEIIIVDNDSSDAETLEYLAAIDGNAARVMRIAGEFNFARLNNLAAVAATGDSLCLLNNDIKALDDNWLDEMLGRLAGVDVGAVGALLVWPSGVVQHGGVVLGPGFAATHAFNDRIRGDVGYGDLLCVAHECSAVTAACLVTRRADYLEVGGMDELRFPVNFNDVDYCLKLRAAGKRIVFTPYAKLLHLESASRGDDKARDRRGRFERELQNLRTKWGEVLVADCYYNPMLSLDPIPFSALAWPPREMAPRIVGRPKPVFAPPGI
jgi:O-antigen biosynthesis protein